MEPMKTLIPYHIGQALAYLNKIKILIFTWQIRWLFGTGGLGDVAFALAKELHTSGMASVSLAMPAWPSLVEPNKGNWCIEDNLAVRQLQVPFGDRTLGVDIYRVPLPNVPASLGLYCYLFRCPEIFEHLEPANPDMAEKAIFFAHAVLECARNFGWFSPHLCHSNDWQAGLIPVLLRTVYGNHPVLGRIATLYTIHNAGGGFQGAFLDSGRLLWLAGLSGWDVFTPGKTRSLEHLRQFNFTKGGIGYSDIVTTVSRSHGQELKMPAFAGGLDGLIRERGCNFLGIVNGLDCVEWNPSTDPFLPTHYSKGDPISMVLEKKRRLRDALRNWKVPAGLPRSGERPFLDLCNETFVISVVSRIDRQKWTILFRALDRLLAMPNVQVCVLGAPHEHDGLGQNYAARIQDTAIRSGGRLLFYKGHDLALSHLVYAVGNTFLVPSVSEPCGLTQMIAANYGAVPCVRKTGGLEDTIFEKADPGAGIVQNGFVFLERVPPGQLIDETLGADGLPEVREAADELVGTVQRALDVFRDDPARWGEIMKNGMNHDWSWTQPSFQYWLLYIEAIWRRQIGPQAS